MFLKRAGVNHLLGDPLANLHKLFIFMEDNLFRLVIELMVSVIRKILPPRERKVSAIYCEDRLHELHTLMDVSSMLLDFITVKNHFFKFGIIFEPISCIVALTECFPENIGIKASHAHAPVLPKPPLRTPSQLSSVVMPNGRKMPCMNF